MEQKSKEILKKLNREKLLMIRCVLGISRKQIADFLGVDVSQYARWENGLICPDILSLKTIVTDYFHIAMDDYLNENISAENHIIALQNNGSAFILSSEKRQPCNYREKTKVMMKSRLSLLRKMNNMSAKTMAALLNVRKEAYGYWERGTSLPDAIMLKNIVTDILNFSVDDFLDESLPIEKLRPLQNNPKAREKALKFLIRDKLPKLRENAGISQDEMATFLEVDRTLYVSWEQGRRLIDTLTLRKIVVDVFHLSLDDFLDEAKSSETLSSQMGNGLQPFLLNANERNIIMHYR